MVRSWWVDQSLPYTDKEELLCTSVNFVVLMRRTGMSSESAATFMASASNSSSYDTDGEELACTPV